MIENFTCADFSNLPDTWGPAKDPVRKTEYTLAVARDPVERAFIRSALKYFPQDDRKWQQGRLIHRRYQHYPAPGCATSP
jgi:hypothetical protein